MDNETLWKIIHSYFEENPQTLVSHHIDSFDDFYRTGIHSIFREKNPITLNSMYDQKMGDFKYKCRMYFGGKDGSKIYFGKPTINDADGAKYMFPNEARLRNMTYAMTIHYDIDLEFEYLLEPGETPKNVAGDMLAELVLSGDDRVEMDEDAGMEMLGGGVDDATALGGRHVFGGEVSHVFGFGGDANDDDAMLGGAPKQTKKEAANVRLAAKYTTNIAANMRDVNEKSMVGVNRQVYRTTMKQVYLGKFPIMVQSSFCILNGLPREARFNLGECKNDLGGYFIVDGKERTIIMQEKFGDNMINISEDRDDKYLYSASIRSVSENASKPNRTLSLKLVAPNKNYTNENIVVSIPNVRSPVPLFILFRALGITNDRDIIDHILLDKEKYSFLAEKLLSSVHDSGRIFTQEAALTYIAHLTKYHTMESAHLILCDYLLPHVGESNYVDKAYFLGYLAFRLLCVSSGLETPTDRDSYKFKRVEVSGSLLYDLFKEYYTMQIKAVHLSYEKSLYYNKQMYEEDLHKLIFEKRNEALDERDQRVVEAGFKKAYKGNWGAAEHTKRIGVVQVLDRLSCHSAMSHLRKTNLEIDPSVKTVGPRVLHSSHWGFIDPIDTPDGGNIGLHKTLAIMTRISRGASREPTIAWMRENAELKRLDELTPTVVSGMAKVIINGYWVGVVADPIGTVRKMKLYRRNGLIPLYTSISFNIRTKTVFVFTDAGRVYRPIFYRDAETDRFSFEHHIDTLNSGDFTWTELVSGFNRKRPEIDFNPYYPVLYSLPNLYEGVPANEHNPRKLDAFIKKKAVLEYVDPSETEDLMIALDAEAIVENRSTKYTHMELHQSTIFGTMLNHVIFPENNPIARDSFSCSQSKQSVSVYHTNYQLRMDKMGVVLNMGEIPLVKSRYLEYISHEEQPYGVNAMVAIMCYTGYNVEDAVLINEGALHRGLFRTTYYTTYEAHEESSKNAHVFSDIKFANIEDTLGVSRLAPGYDYSKLDRDGIIKEGMQVDDRTVLIGLVSTNSEHPGVAADTSKKPKKGQLGIVDKAFITEGEEGERIAKVRVREERQPIFGDKMASRAGQKGTVGLVVPEKDMPYTANGIRPDIIVNPHAIPTRMTIGQLVECITGKACAMQGGFGDCTAFNNKGSKVGVFGSMLATNGFHSSGSEIMYNGMTGEQIEMEVFFGPTYYMRLKHMVNDKINYRATGPRTALTRQPVAGRANDGGLRIGEMERDVLISHGIANFLTESMMVRGDNVRLAVCNTTGAVAICNPSNNLWLSPLADGPLKFKPTIVSGDTGVTLETVSKYGRSFSMVEVPYSFKLLMQELQAVNIQMRIITENNISQIDSISNSDNVQRLAHVDGLDKVLKLGAAEIGKYREREQENSRRMHPQDAEERYSRFVSARRSEDTQELESENQSPEYASESPYQGPTQYQNEQTSPGWAPPPDNRPQKFIPKSPDNTPPQKFIPKSPDNTPPQKFIPKSPDNTPPPPVWLSPNSPSWSPPNANINPTINNRYVSESSSGSSQAGGSNIEEGTNVLYRGSANMGLSPESLWKVRRIGDGFITIGNDAFEGSESVQVVSPDELFLPTPEFYSNLVQAQATQMPMMQMPMQGPGGGGIHINPIIKIVNGPDHSVNAGEADNIVPEKWAEKRPALSPASASVPMSMPEGQKKELTGVDFSKGILINKLE
jgi:DNA-directed RNA polymerase II subunit RPB2